MTKPKTIKKDKKEKLMLTFIHMIGIMYENGFSMTALKGEIDDFYDEMEDWK